MNKEYGETGRQICRSFRIRIKPTDAVADKAPVNKAIPKVSKIKRYKNASGYQIRYSTKTSMAGAKIITIKGNKNVTRTIRNLKRGKTYYVQVRPYKNYKGRKYLGILTGRIKVRVR